MEILIWGLMLVSVLVLFILNVFKIKEKDKKYEMMLSHITALNILLPGDIELRQKTEYYKPNSFFKMHNKGSSLESDIGEIKFKPIGAREEYYL